MRRHVFPHAPSPTITNFFRMAAISVGKQEESFYMRLSQVDILSKCQNNQRRHRKQRIFFFFAVMRVFTCDVTLWEWAKQCRYTAVICRLCIPRYRCLKWFAEITGAHDVSRTQCSTKTFSADALRLKSDRSDISDRQYEIALHLRERCDLHVVTDDCSRRPWIPNATSRLQSYIENRGEGVR